MAIKGKARSRGRRVVSAPPRPHVVVPKPPTWRRKGVLITVAVLALGGIAAGIFFPLRASSSRAARQELLDRQIQSVERFTNLLVAEFPEDNQAVPGGLYLFYPTLEEDLDTLATGELSAQDAIAKGEEITRSADAAADGIQEIDLTAQIPPEFTMGRQAGIEGPGLLLQELQDAQFLLIHSFRTYAVVGSLVQAAADAKGETRRELLDQVAPTRQRADELFVKGFIILAQIRSRLDAPAA